MGYTHYFTYRQRPTKEQVAYVGRGLNALKKFGPKTTTVDGGYYIKDEIIICDGFGKNELSVFPEDGSDIFFNGDEARELDHETMVIAVEDEESMKKIKAFQGEDFNFCKTARKPYSLYVEAALIMLKHTMGEDVDVSSDGEESDWAPAFPALVEAMKKADFTESEIPSADFEFNANGSLELLG